MGTTLTGTTPQDTYDSLIKVTDNGALSGTAKFLSDGLGNDSVLALSTTAVGVGTASPSTYGANLAVLGSGNGIISVGQATSFATLQSNGQDFYINAKGTGNLILRNGSGDTERMRITSTGNVGIGTSTPSVRLTVKGDAAVTQTIGGITVEQCAFFLRSNEVSTLRVAFDASANAYIYSSESGGILSFGTRTAPNNNIIASVTANGLTFNGDTAAANALDDYEEGTWSMGVSFGGASVGVTTSVNTGTYTKIGRQVTVNGRIDLTSKGSSTGLARITGLPFTVANANANLSAASFVIQNITFLDQFEGYADANSTSIVLFQTTNLGVATVVGDGNFANNSIIFLSLTYFV